MSTNTLNRGQYFIPDLATVGLSRNKSKSRNGLNTGNVGSTSSSKNISIREETRTFEEMYTVDRKLGKGAFGTVYLVRKKTPDRSWRAVKVINVTGGKGSANLQDVIDEITALNRLQCTAQTPAANTYMFNECATVHIYDWFTRNNRREFYIELDYIPGGDARMYKRLIDNSLVRGSFSNAIATLQKLAQNFGDLVQTLARVHRLCVLHRDIKPENLLYNEETGKVVFSDFGLSCFLPQCTGIVGTELFMDPYALYEKPNVLDEKSDIYALGLTMYELITNRTLDFNWVKQDEYTIRYQQQTQRLNQISDLYKNLILDNAEILRNPLYLGLPILAPQVMIEAVKRMINPWKPNSRPSLDSILNALHSGRVDDIISFENNYLCAASTIQIRNANRSEAEEFGEIPVGVSKVNCTGANDDQLEEKTIQNIGELVNSIVKDEDVSDIDDADDLSGYFYNNFSQTDPCLVQYIRRNLSRYYDIFTALLDRFTQ